MNISILIAMRYPIFARFTGGDVSDLENLEWNDPDNERPSDEDFQQAWAEIEPIVQAEEIKRQLAETDTKLPRTVEDNMDLLIQKELVSLDDYPEAVQELYLLKKDLRGQL